MSEFPLGKSVEYEFEISGVVKKDVQSHNHELTIPGGGPFSQNGDEAGFLPLVPLVTEALRMEVITALDDFPIAYHVGAELLDLVVNLLIQQSIVLGGGPTALINEWLQVTTDDISLLIRRELRRVVLVQLVLSHQMLQQLMYRIQSLLPALLT